MAVNPSRAEQRREATRAALVAVAREAFVEHGYAGVSTEEIIRRAGVSRGALYHHFPSKEALVQATAEAIEIELMQSLVGALDPDDTALDRIIAGARAYLATVVGSEELRRVLLERPLVLGLEAFQEVQSRYGIAVLTEVLREAMGTGEVAAGDPAALAQLVWALNVQAATMVARAQDREAERRRYEAALVTVLTGLRVP